VESEVKHHVAAWETALANLSISGSEDRLVSESRNADFVIHAGAPGFFDRPLKSLLRLLTSEDVARFVWEWGDAPTGRNSGFYCSLHQRLFDPARHRTVPYPLTFNREVDFADFGLARFDFGFVGGITAGVRKRIVDQFGSRASAFNALIKVQTTNWFNIFEQQNSSAMGTYAESLASTRFVLCPRGAGNGSARLFETMKAGRVPVILSDSYVLPEGIDWSSCSIRIRERDVSKIPDVITSHMDGWEAIARNARREWENNFSSESLFPYLVNALRSMSRSLPAVTPIYNARYVASAAITAAENDVRPLAGKIRNVVLRRA
jgi:hypothetical protein